MAIDFDQDLDAQMAEETGPALERPLHFEDEEIDDPDGYQPVEADDIEDDAPVEAADEEGAE